MTRGAKQPKIKIAQPVQLEAALRDVLEKHGVRKPPTVDKVEALEKAATAKKWLFFVTPDRRDGLTHVKLEVPGPDGLIYFEATALTTALAMTKALCDALENGPQQSNFLDSARSPDAPPDPDGKDLPMFNGNGGVASVAEINLQETADELASDIEAMAIEESTNPWTFLFVVNPADVKTWKEAAPVDAEGAPIVEWEEGDELNDRGFYLDPEFHYDAAAGEIRLKDDDGQPGELVWSRDAAPKKARSGAAPKAMHVDFDQAEALPAAGVQPTP